ncbi:MAG: DegV family EDD domain-containing protein [Anaerolineae bacterium]|nr:DegV family EDD domain-containing protein [Anaerolineae bacterium]
MRVTVLDSRQLSMGTGFLVEAAAKAAALGHDLGQILAMLEEQIRRTHVFAALDTLKFLQRSGRMSWTVAGLGTLLQIKPLLKMYDGQSSAERVRTRDRAIRRVIELLQACAPLERVALLHTNALESAEALRQRAADSPAHRRHPRDEHQPGHRRAHRAGRGRVCVHHCADVKPKGRYDDVP